VTGASGRLRSNWPQEPTIAAAAIAAQRQRRWAVASFPLEQCSAMDRVHATQHFVTQTTYSDAEGWTAIELLETSGGAKAVVARVVFWDAQGQFALELGVPELPLTIVEELIAEARSTIEFR